MIETAAGFLIFKLLRYESNEITPFDDLIKLTTSADEGNNIGSYGDAAHYTRKYYSQHSLQ